MNTRTLLLAVIAALVGYAVYRSPGLQPAIGIACAVVGLLYVLFEDGDEDS